MRRFGESHGALSEAPRVSAFLRDAALYFRSEAEVPKRLEAHLAHLERSADEFRSVALEPGSSPKNEGDPGSEQAELRRECEDLQVDIGVLLESALMAAQQALAEYKKMHCRLELLATEYEPHCKLELDGGTRPALLPLLADENAKVGSASQGLEGLVRELQARGRQLRNLAAELRAVMLRRAACGGQPGDKPGG